MNLLKRKRKNRGFTINIGDAFTVPWIALIGRQIDRVKAMRNVCPKTLQLAGLVTSTEGVSAHASNGPNLQAIDLEDG
jgi:hypothetical protein